MLIKRFQEGYQPEEGVWYILETNLEYPEELHNDHAEYPLAPERMRVAGEEQSILQEELREAYGIKLTNWHKLVAMLYDKDNYVVHHQNLKYYIKKGLCLKKIHCAIRFYESDWMRPYIEINTILRQQTTNSFERDLFKKMVNAAYGKTWRT